MQKDIATGKPHTAKDFRVQLMYRRDDTLHHILGNDMTYRKAKKLYLNSNSGKEVYLQLIDVTTGKVLFEDK